MNLYRLNCKRKYIVGLQMEEESFVTIAITKEQAENIIKSRFGNVFDIKEIKRVQDGTYFINETFILDTVS